MYLIESTHLINTRKIKKNKNEDCDFNEMNKIHIFNECKYNKILL